MNYVEAVNEGWPDVQCYANGNPSVYANIVFVSGSPIPTEAELDAYIECGVPTAANLDQVPVPKAVHV